MKTKFSFFDQLEKNKKTINEINECAKICFGPLGGNGILGNQKGNIKMLSTGSLLMNSLDFHSSTANILLKLLQQASTKTYTVSGDGSTLTILFSCELLKSIFLLIGKGYNLTLISNGFKKISFFLLEKIIEYSTPISNSNQLIGLLKTNLGKKIHSNLFVFFKDCVNNISRDGLLLVEENEIEQNEIEFIQGMELEKGFSSSYFITDFKNFEVVFNKPYLFITNIGIDSLNQIRTILEFVKKNNRPLVMVVEDIQKDVLSTLVLNSLQKKLKIVVIQYKSIQFQKNGILEDLALLTHCNYFDSKFKNLKSSFNVEDLGQLEKVIVTKKKSTFLVSKFARLTAQRRINELNRELLNSETEYEKNIFKTRIARLSGHIAKIKIGLSNQYEMDDQRQRIENAIQNIRSSLEEGIVPGGGIFYLFLREEISNWSTFNLIGEEILASSILQKVLFLPFQRLMENSTSKSLSFELIEKLHSFGYPYGYDLLTKKIVHTLEEGLVDSSKSVRSILWNSISLVSTLITCE